MGSSVKKKREKKKDFQVSSVTIFAANLFANSSPEGKIEGRQVSSQARQLHRYQFQGKVYVM
jgi:hypothetical protein